MGSEHATFSSYREPEATQRHWWAAGLGAVGVYVLIGMLVVALTGRTPPRLVPEPRVDLKFIDKVVKAEPPPPLPSLPPAVVAAPPSQPQAAPAAAPVVRPEQKVRKLEKPPPVQELVAPREMPVVVPAEADPIEDKGVAVYGEPGTGDPAGLEGGMATGVAGGKVGIIELPPDAVAPRPLRSNAPPRYPESARRRGKSGKVKLRIVIYADGTVGTIEIVEGEEPFVSAAREAVAGWRFTPARREGQAISVYRVIPINFNLEE